MVLGLGSWEIVLVALALLVFFGPEHAPKLLRRAGELQARARRAFQELEDAVEREEEQLREPLQGSRGELPSSQEDREDEDGEDTD